MTGAEVTAAFFPATKGVPVLGRLFVSGDYRSDAVRLAVLHHDLWTRAFKGAPDVIGSTIQIDGRPHVVVGIMPRDFNLPAGAQLWIARGTR